MSRFLLSRRVLPHPPSHWLLSLSPLLQRSLLRKRAYTGRMHDVVVGKAYENAERLVILKPVLIRRRMRSGACVCGPERVSSTLRRSIGRVGTKTCFTSKFLHCRGSSRRLLTRGGVGIEVGTVEHCPWQIEEAGCCGLQSSHSRGGHCDRCLGHKG